VINFERPLQASKSQPPVDMQVYHKEGTERGDKESGDPVIAVESTVAQGGHRSGDWRAAHGDDGLGDSFGVGSQADQRRRGAQTQAAPNPILKNWRWILGVVVLSLLAWILAPLLGPVAKFFGDAFGALVGAVAFLAKNPWLIPLLGGLAAIGMVALRAYRKARDRKLSPQELSTSNANTNGEASNLRRPALYAEAAEHLKAGSTRRDVAEATLRGAAVEQDATGAISPETAERLHKNTYDVSEFDTPRTGDDPRVFKYMQELHTMVKSTPSTPDFIRKTGAAPIPGPNPKVPTYRPLVGGAPSPGGDGLARPHHRK